MEHMLSQNPSLNDEDKAQLLQLAHEVVAHGALTGCKLQVEPGRFPDHLWKEAAAFITIRKQGSLRGCIGSIAAHQPLVLEVADKAYAAAFGDPRFLPVSMSETKDLSMQVSILSPLQELLCNSEDEALLKIRAGVDGLVLDLDGRRGTFLPSMWEQLPNKADFWGHLKIKAGLPMDFWVPEMRVYRFETECFADSSYFAAPLS